MMDDIGVSQSIGDAVPLLSSMAIDVAAAVNALVVLAAKNSASVVIFLLGNSANP
jgi:hypothetical protein